MITFIGGSQPFVDAKETNKYTYVGIFHKLYFIDDELPVCQYQHPIERVEMLRSEFVRLKMNNKYIPHQGKQECARRIG